MDLQLAVTTASGCGYRYFGAVLSRGDLFFFFLHGLTDLLAQLGATHNDLLEDMSTLPPPSSLQQHPSLCSGAQTPIWSSLRTFTFNSLRRASHTTSRDPTATAIDTLATATSSRWHVESRILINLKVPPSDKPISLPTAPNWRQERQSTRLRRPPPPTTTHSQYPAPSFHNNAAYGLGFTDTFSVPRPNFANFVKLGQLRLLTSFGL